MHDSNTPEKYFAAANTYNGFKSYFSDVFNPSEYDKLYILKGGPGTGKSSFMKRFSTNLVRLGCKMEEIYCSSDQNSLDGIIACFNGKRIAIIDGTSPHETDARIPGACDEIINLGTAWNSRWLRGERERIINAGAQKSQAYKSAYSSLLIAGTAANVKNGLYADLYDDKNAYIEIKSLADTISSKKSSKTKTRLISAFNKHGTVRLNTLENAFEKTFSIVGSDYAAARFLSDLSAELKKRSENITVFPTPLNPQLVEAISIPEESTCFIIGGGGKAIDTDFFMKKDAIVNEKAKCAEECRRIALQDAARWFSVASELHFTLEDIYTHAMNFDIVDSIYDKKFTEACDILNLKA